jgi:integrase
MKTDLERHFDLVRASHGYATPALVLTSYKTPPQRTQQQSEKKENTQFSLELDTLIRRSVKYCRQLEKAQKEPVYQQERLGKLSTEKESLLKELETLMEKTCKIFDSTTWIKTLILTMNHHLIFFLQSVLTETRSVNTLLKLWGSKTRLLEFMEYRYKVNDMALEDLSFRFIKEYLNYSKVTYKNNDNTIWKYGIILKEIVNEAVSYKWVTVNVFDTYECKYRQPEDKEWPSLDDMLHLINVKLPKELSDIRYVFIFQSFAGLSYAEVESAGPEHIVKGIDGKKWIDQKRQKTNVEETLPLLPICLQILEMFENDPRCLRKGRLLPVPTDQHYNRALKKIGSSKYADIPSLNNCHQARYVFVNEITHPNGVDERTVGIMIGQKNSYSIRTYLKPNKKVISSNMQMVEDKLYAKGGPLSSINVSIVTTGAKVIAIKKRKASNSD